MVVDLNLLDGALRWPAELLDGADLDDVVGAHIGGDYVTVEAFARWLHGEIGRALGSTPDTTLAVRVWESTVAFGGYRAPLASSR